MSKINEIKNTIYRHTSNRMQFSAAIALYIKDKKEINGFKIKFYYYGFIGPL